MIANRGTSRAGLRRGRGDLSLMATTRRELLLASPLLSSSLALPSMGEVDTCFHKHCSDDDLLLCLFAVKADESHPSAYDYSALMFGEQVSLSKYKGKVVVFVNVASE